MKENVPITDPVWMVDPNWIEKTGGFARDMTLRDYFAAQMMGYGMDSALQNKATNIYKEASFLAYKCADYMIKHKEKNEYTKIC